MTVSRVSSRETLQELPQEEDDFVIPWSQKALALISKTGFVVAIAGATSEGIRGHYATAGIGLGFAGICASNLWLFREYKKIGSVTRLARQFSSQGHRLENQTESIDELTTRLQISGQNFLKLQEEYAALEKKHQGMEAHFLARLEEEMNKGNETLLLIQQIETQTVFDLELLQEKIKNLHQEIENYRTQNNALSSLLEQQTKQEKLFRSEINRLEGDLANFHRSIQDYTQENERLQTILISLRGTIPDQEGQELLKLLEDFRKEVSGLTNALHQAKEPP